jgi:hypothetical protein
MSVLQLGFLQYLVLQLCILQLGILHQNVALIYLHSRTYTYLHTRQLTLVVRLQGVHFMNWTIWIKKNFGQFLLSNFGQIYIPTYIQVCAIDNCTYNFSDYSGHKYFFRYYKPLSGHPCKLQLVNYCPKLIHKIDPRPDPLPRCG